MSHRRKDEFGPRAYLMLWALAITGATALALELINFGGSPAL